MAPTNPIRRKWPRRLLLAALLIAGLCAALLSAAPATPVAPMPGAVSVSEAKAAALRLQSLAATRKPGPIAFSWSEAATIATLAGRASDVDRIAIGKAGDAIAIRTSIPWRFGLWLNIAATVAPGAGGFPPVSFRIGHVTLPQTLSRWAIEGARWFLNRRGAQLPPIDTLVSKTEISGNFIAATMQVPRWIGLTDMVNPAMAVDQRLVEAAYCRLSKLQAKRPATELSALLNRAFAGQPGTVEANRATFVALAVLLIPDGGDRLIGEQSPAMAACATPYREIRLLDRADLAKHWTLSAALSAGFGSGISRELGTWKEISDSGPGGSGFSFIDLSADRSGVRFGQRAADPATSAATARALATASTEAILPVHALALAEGLTEAEFRARFTSTESGRYDAMIARIDRVLDERD